MPSRCLELLAEEHRWIGWMLDGLEGVRERLETHGRVEAESAGELLALFAHFADGLHQEREERVLFPRLLARAGTVEERLALGRLFGEHEEERVALARLGERLLGAIYGRAQDVRDFRAALGTFVRLHRAHLAHENRELLPLAARLLRPEDEAVLARGFAELERAGPDPLTLRARIQSVNTALGLGPTGASQH